MDFDVVDDDILLIMRVVLFVFVVRSISPITILSLSRKFKVSRNDRQCIIFPSNFDSSMILCNRLLNTVDGFEVTDFTDDGSTTSEFISQYKVSILSVMSELIDSNSAMRSSSTRYEQHPPIEF